jgi:hypothetical protein
MTKEEAGIARNSARSQGLTRYIGRPCRTCNNIERRVTTGRCIFCELESTKKRLKRLTGTDHPYYLRHRERVRRSALKREYGLSIEDYNNMLANQDGKCAICGGTEWRRLSVDHCHTSLKIRGLLCSPCNKALGVLEPHLSKAINYIKGGRYVRKRV